MRVMAQMAMVMNLDKCIGCHTCSVTCKQAWTNRSGVEYVWFNNVETRPGQGYPRTYEDQDRWQGGWELTKRGRLTLRAGGRVKKLLSIFANPLMPSITDYYEPWTYDYENLIDAPPQQHSPVARPKSLISGKDMKVSWSANWDDDLGGSPELTAADPVLRKISDNVRLEFERTFMFYLPRICEHCLNPSCAASCPSGAIYKRSEDGIVLVDQDRCRGWRMCVTGCPYKKVYFNHRTGKAEKCTFCFPRVEVGIPTVCAETCVGRLRYIGLVLYDADAVLAAASVPDDKNLCAAQRRVFLDPADPAVVSAAEQAGVPRDWVLAAQRSPVWALISRFQVALPLHPEYRTMPMVWYIPPLSPVVDVLRDTGHDAEAAGSLFGAIDALRIPVGYLAELFTAGDARPVRDVLARLAAMRAFMRDVNLGREPDIAIPAAVGMTPEDIEDMHRLLAIAKYDERYVIPPAHAELGDVGQQAHQLEELACSLDYDGGPGMGGSGPFGESSGGPAPVAVENFHALRQRQTSDTFVDPADGTARVNLLNWDGMRVASVAFGYPDDWLGQLPLLDSAAGSLTGPAAALLRQFLDVVHDTGPSELRQRHVDTFDLRRRCCPYLTYYSTGDTRKRGMALLAFTAAYRVAGFELAAAELPDHIAVLCEFTAAAPDPGRALFRRHRAGVELLRTALADAGAPWLHVLDVIRAVLPEAAPRDLQRALELARSGPPAEEVGLEPFAPPEYMGGRR